MQWKEHEKQSITKCTLDSGEIKVYDMGISIDFFETKGLNHTDFPDYIFIGEGFIYSVDEYVYPNKIRKTYFYKRIENKNGQRMEN